MKIQENVDLAPYTTLGVGGPTKYFAEIKLKTELQAAIQFAEDRSLEIFILGDGSNVVISDEGFKGLVIRLVNKGVDLLENFNNAVLIKFGSGENWDEVVNYAVNHEYWGIENMSYIPGLIGASAVQNILAYGQQLSDVLEYLEVYDLKEKQYKKINNEECKFGYKKSIFNTSDKNRYLILSTVLRLRKNGKPIIKYPDVINYLKDKKINEPSIKQMRQALIDIRTNKFGSWGDVGTAGSFFANPILDLNQFDSLHKKVAGFADNKLLKELDLIKDKFVDSEYGKMPVAFILDKVLNLKGMKVGGAKLSEKQGNAIINENFDATAKDVMKLFKKVRQIVYEKTCLEVSNEPELIGFTDEELKDYFSLPES